ncbi:MAG: hypothetical protein LBV78_15450 [Kitasatospora sp.]|jgi:GTP-dependent phosphoenolpyruvate carboxykinase|nr:hypothetical protein [Kitasatospora sp.]
MASTPPRTTEGRPAAHFTAHPTAHCAARPAAEPERAAAAPVPMRALLAAGRAAEAVSTPPERDAA